MLVTMSNIVVAQTKEQQLFFSVHLFYFPPNIHVGGHQKPCFHVAQAGN